ncbi:hypothetical protein PG990_003052 [Apiospora arundinis]
MRFSIPTIMAVLIVGSQAIPTTQPSVTLRIPPGQRDGAYIVHNWGTPQELHERLPDAPEHERQAYTAARRATTDVASEVEVSSNDEAISSATHLFRRDDYIACGCIGLNHQDCDDATHGIEFFAKRDTTVSPGMCFYQFARSVVAFACVNAGDIRHSYTIANMQDNWRAISRQCGYYSAGTVGWKNHFAVGYMTSDHKDYFGDAWKSPRTSC